MQLQVLIIDHILHKIPFSFDSVFSLFIFEPSSSPCPVLPVVIAGFWTHLALHICLFWHCQEQNSAVVAGDINKMKNINFP